MWGCSRWWWWLLLLFGWEGVGEGRGDMLMTPSSVSSSRLSAPPPLAKPGRSASVSYMLSTGSLSSMGPNTNVQRQRLLWQLLTRKTFLRRWHRGFHRQRVREEESSSLQSQISTVEPRSWNTKTKTTSSSQPDTAGCIQRLREKSQTDVYGKSPQYITVTSCQDSSYKKSFPITERVRDRQYDFPYQNVQKGNKSQIPLNVLLRISLVKVYKCACAETK